MQPLPDPGGRRLPHSLLFSLGAWGLLALILLLAPQARGAFSSLLAGAVAALTWAIIGWYAQHQGGIPSQRRLTGLVARYAVPAHLVYGAGLMLLAATFGGRAAFGIAFSDVFPVGPLLAGALLGLFMAAGLELDAGLAAAGEPVWYSLVFTGVTWGLLVIVFAAAGGLFFVLTLVACRALLSLSLYRWHLWTPTADSTGGEVLALSLLVLPAAAFIAGL